ncbi:MAG: hypothetical protein JSR34_02200 [Proteobacteria bacterium]|nr:hypothetical protein [Pseudomonadota bacterium]
MVCAVCLGSGVRCIQSTYGPDVPAAHEVVDALGLHARKGRRAWCNLPPATVCVFTRGA